MIEMLNQGAGKRKKPARKRGKRKGLTRRAIIWRSVARKEGARSVSLGAADAGRGLLTDFAAVK